MIVAAQRPSTLTRLSGSTFSLPGLGGTLKLQHNMAPSLTMYDMLSPFLARSRTRHGRHRPRH